jgi:hypothetical protein
MKEERKEGEGRKEGERRKVTLEEGRNMKMEYAKRARIKNKKWKMGDTVKRLIVITLRVFDVFDV